MGFAIHEAVSVQICFCHRGSSNLGIDCNLLPIVFFFYQSCIVFLKQLVGYRYVMYDVSTYT